MSRCGRIEAHQSHSNVAVDDPAPRWIPYSLIPRAGLWGKRLAFTFTSMSDKASARGSEDGLVLNVSDFERVSEMWPVSCVCM